MPPPKMQDVLKKAGEATKKKEAKANAASSSLSTSPDQPRANSFTGDVPTRCSNKMAQIAAGETLKMRNTRPSANPTSSGCTLRPSGNAIDAQDRELISDKFVSHGNMFSTFS